MTKPFNIHDWQDKQRLVENNNDFERLRYPKHFKFLDGLKADNKINRWGITSLQTKFNLSDEKAIEIFNLYTSSLKEHHGDEEFPGKDLSAFDLLDKIKTSDPELYSKLESFMKKMDENSLGTGTSISADTGPAYATPKAFAKDDKWKNKTYKYEQ